MARTRSLTNLLADLDYVADTQGLTTRHDPTNKTRALNQSIQRFREKLSTEGFSHFLQPYSTTTAVGATSPFPFQVVDLGSGPAPALVRVFRVHVTYNNRVYDLEGVEFTEVTRYQDAYNGVRAGIPIAFASQTTTKVALMPPPDAAYAITYWYLPVLADLVAGSDTFDGVAGWEEWVVYDAAVHIANRDRDATQRALLAAERDNRWADIIKAAGQVNRAATQRRRDTWGERRQRERYSKLRLP